jgi:hypothetical protein
MKWRLSATAVLLALPMGTFTSGAASDLGFGGSARSVSTGIESVTRLPVAFTVNRGQWPENVLFRTGARGATLWVTREGLVYQFTRRVQREDAGLSGRWEAGFSGSAAQGARVPRGRMNEDRDSIEQLVVRASFAGASPTPLAVGLDELPYKCNYFLGNDPALWRADVPNYSSVILRDIYPGVDVKYFDDGSGQVSYRFVASRGSDVGKIRVSYEGAVEPSLNATGRPILRTDWGQAIEPIDAQDGGSGLASPRAYPSAEGLAGGAGHEQAGAPRAPMAVGLSYSTYVGGSGYDVGLAIAVDDSGQAYVTGETASADFPLKNSFRVFAGDLDAFVTKLSSAGNSLIFSTYFGGSGHDEGWDIAVDSVNSPYVTGQTASVDFPTVMPFQSDQGLVDAFVTKLYIGGNGFAYSTYVGGSDVDYGYGIAVDGYGSPYITGVTRSTDLPVANNFQADQGGDDAFVVKLSPFGSFLDYSTYLGGSSDDFGLGIALDAGRNAYVTGWTNSSNFPAFNPYQTRQAGEDVFVTKLAPSGTTLVYSTYLGGNGDERCWGGIAVDGAGCAHITGWTASTNFPTLNAYQAGLSLFEAFVTKLSAAGNSLIYSTYLGGSDVDDGWDIAVDIYGHAVVTGGTTSSDFPTQNPYQLDQGIDDAFVTTFSKTGNSLVYSTYLGGGGADMGRAVAVDASGSAYVTGYTQSPDFPAKNAYQAVQGSGDVFVTKLGAPPVTDTLWFFGFCPIDLVVTDPLNDSIGLGFNTIGLGSSYDTLADINSPNLSGPDGQRDDIVTIPHPVAGDYRVRMIREPGSADNEKFTLSIRIDGNQLMTPDDYHEATVASLGVTIPSTYVWTAAATLPGDVNADGVFTSSDIIFLVNYVFKGGQPPIVNGHGDCNCDDKVTSSDVIYLVNHVFKSGPTPCSQSVG